MTAQPAAVPLVCPRCARPHPLVPTRAPTSWVAHYICECQARWVVLVDPTGRVRVWG